MFGHQFDGRWKSFFWLFLLPAVQYVNVATAMEEK